MRQHSFSSLTSFSRMALWGHLFGNEVSGTMPTACAACSSSPASSILMNVRVVSSDPRSPKKCLKLRACASAVRLDSGYTTRAPEYASRMT